MKTSKLYNKALDLGRNHGGYFVTTFLNSAIPLLFLPVLTRYLTPAEYANIGLFNFYFAISNSLAGSSLPAMISKNFFDQPKEYVAKVVGNSIWISFILCIAISVLILIFHRLILSYVDLPLFWLLIIPWCSFFHVVFNQGVTVMRNQKKVLAFTYHKVATITINVLISLVLIVLLNFGWEGRLWGIVSSFAIMSIFVLWYLKKNGYLSFTYDLQIQKKTANLLLYLMPNSFQGIIISQVGIFFMQLYFTKELLGVYYTGYQISFAVKLLFTTIGFSWGPFLYQQLSESGKKDKVRIVQYFYLLALVLLSGSLFVSLFSKQLLWLFTTSDYFGASVFIPWLSLGFVFNGLFVFLMPILIKLEKQKQINVVTLISMVIMLVLNNIFIKHLGYMGIAYAFCLSYAIMFIMFIYLVQQSFPLPWLKPFKKTIRNE